VSLLGATALAGSLSADPVVLKATDGTTNLVGELIGFDSEYYLLQTELGDLRVASDRVTCEGAACPVFETVEADVVIGGADTLATGLMPLLLAGFATDTGAEARSQSGLSDGRVTTTLTGQDGFGDQMGTVAVQSGSSEDGFNGLQDGSFKVALSSRRITPDEARALSSNGAGNMIDPAQEHIVAIDSLVIVVNQANPVDALSIADLAAIYAGQITNWSQVGGPDLPIQIVTQTDNGTNAVFREGVFGSNNAIRPSNSFQATDNVAAAVYVDENLGAIAYVGFAFQRGQKPLTLISECGIGTTPDAFSVKTEEYALFRRLYLYTRADAGDQMTEDFVKFSTSPAANNVILQSGFIGLSVEQVAQGSNGLRASRIQGTGNGSFENDVINTMIAEMGTHDRLSSTFRFKTGSTQLDPRGLVDLERLVTYLENQPNGTEVTFVGFADNVGAFEPNMHQGRGLWRSRASRLQHHRYRARHQPAGRNMDQNTMNGGSRMKRIRALRSSSMFGSLKRHNPRLGSGRTSERVNPVKTPHQRMISGLKRLGGAISLAAIMATGAAAQSSASDGVYKSGAERIDVSDNIRFLSQLPRRRRRQRG